MAGGEEKGGGDEVGGSCGSGDGGSERGVDR